MEIPKPPIGKVTADNPSLSKVLEEICIAQRDADAEYYGGKSDEVAGLAFCKGYNQARAETLKEVGKRMKDLEKTGHLNRTIILYLIENLERGQFPQE